MKNERTTNEAIADYNAKEWEQRQQWSKVLAKPTVKREIKPAEKVRFFSRFFKVA